MTSPELETPLERLHSAKETCQLLGLSRNTVYSLMARGELRHVSVGRRRLVPTTAIADFIAQHSS